MQNQYNPVKKCNKPTQQQGITSKKADRRVVIYSLLQIQIVQACLGIKTNNLTAQADLDLKASTALCVSVTSRCLYSSSHVFVLEPTSEMTLQASY